jgi:hypothetical protein
VDVIVFVVHLSYASLVYLRISCLSFETAMDELYNSYNPKVLQEEIQRVVLCTLDDSIDSPWTSSLAETAPPSTKKHKHWLKHLSREMLPRSALIQCYAYRSWCYTFVIASEFVRYRSTDVWLRQSCCRTTLDPLLDHGCILSFSSFAAPCTACRNQRLVLLQPYINWSVAYKGGDQIHFAHSSLRFQRCCVTQISTAFL